MPTQMVSLQASYGLVATGPVDVILSVEEGGWFAVHSSADPAAITAGHAIRPGAVVPVRLSGNDFLHMRGRGAASVSLVDNAAGANEYGLGTREHAIANLSRQAVGATSARVALPTLGPSREIYVMSSARCFFRTGDSTVVAAAGTSHPLATDERFYLRVPVGHTHIAFIRDAVDGNITICPVA